LAPAILATSFTITEQGTGAGAGAGAGTLEDIILSDTGVGCTSSPLAGVRKRYLRINQKRVIY